MSLMGWDVAKDVVLVEFARDSVKPRQKVVRIDDCKPARAARERVQDLLVGRGALGESRNDFALDGRRVGEAVDDSAGGAATPAPPSPGGRAGRPPPPGSRPSHGPAAPAPGGG